MDDIRIDHALKVLAGAAGRRDALRSLGAAGTALLAALGLGTHAAAQKQASRGGKGGGKGRSRKSRRKTRGPATSDAAPSVTAAPLQAAANDKKDGPTGPTGPAGPTGAASTIAGPAGATGPTGSMGAAGVPGDPCAARLPVLRRGRFETGNASGIIGSEAQCNAGEHAVTGGYEFSMNPNRPGDLKWVTTFPASAEGSLKPVAWIVTGEMANVGPDARWTIQAWVICLPD